MIYLYAIGIAFGWVVSGLVTAEIWAKYERGPLGEARWLIVVLWPAWIAVVLVLMVPDDIRRWWRRR